MGLVDAKVTPRDDMRHRHRMVTDSDDAACVCRLMEAAVAATFAVTIDELRASSRCTAKAAFARQCAMYIAHVALGLSYKETGALFHRDRTTAAYACRLVEMRRDNAAIDRLLDMLEDLCAEIACCVSASSQVRP